MTPAKTVVERPRWNIVAMVACGVIGVATSQIDRITGKAVDMATIVAKVDETCKEVHRVDVSGCQPSIEVRRELVGVTRDIQANTTRSLENREDVKKILASQASLAEKQDTIIKLLTSMQEKP